MTVVDIPANWYLRQAVAVTRFLRKSDTLRNIVWEIKDRIVLGPVTKLHLGPVHDIRKFSVTKKNLKDGRVTYEHLEGLANHCRDVMADVLEIWPSALHCTVKLCSNQPGNRKEDTKVYTIARSTPCDRPAQFGQTNAHIVGRNSTFAALVGCSDNRTNWAPHAYTCFTCNDLTKHSNYDCSRPNWNDYWRSTSVFPLRYRTPDESHRVFGFLTFDSHKIGAFRGMPNIFEYHNSADSEKKAKSEYDRLLAYRSAYHVGGILADSLSSVFFPITSKKKANGNDLKNP